MAGAKPGVHVVQLKPIVVPQSLLDGAKFIKWDDDSGQATPVTLRVDKNGFFLYWTDQNKETEFLEISSIRDTRTGKYAKTPKRTKPDSDPKLQYCTNIGSQETPIEDKTVTVVYGLDFVNTNFLNFCCDRREIAKEWTDELLKMAYNLLALNASATTMLYKAHIKITLSVDKDGKIPVKNIVKMFAQNREDKKRVEQALISAGLSSGKNEFICPSKFPFEVFFNFYKHLTGRNEAEKIFNELCGGKTMTAAQLVSFLNQQQRDPRLNEILYPYVTMDRAKDIIHQHELQKHNAQKGLMGFDGFLRYLMSDDNAIVAPEKFDLNVDMNLPLSHYFINSSHNTYLTGHQLTGRSSVEIYRQCLLAGCRCIELDCWNGRPSEDEPIITHGFTVVTEVNFKDVIEAIAESAFKTSGYPVILSFENHCSPRIQAKMAMYCRKIFGDALLSEPLSSHLVVPGHPLPSPNQLIRKIIIKNKKKHYHHRGSNNSNSGNGEAKGSGSPVTVSGVYAVPALGVPTSDVKNETLSMPRLQKTNSRDSQSDSAINGAETITATLAPNGDIDDSVSESDSEDDEYVETGHRDIKESTDGEAGTAERESEAGAEMSALVNYIQPVHFHSFEVSEKRNRSYEISSFVETSATTFLKEHPVDFVNYNKRQLSRIYPRGTRVDSSNYMPQVYWNAGCQLVALNFQTLDLAMQLNLGIFEYNGRSGYLLKPDFMRRHDRKFDPFAESTVDGIIAGSLSVKIISGQFISDKRVGTYVEVESYGLPADTVRKRFRTKIVQSNGINPVYDEEPFVFKKVVLPDLCVIRIIVCEENGKIIGRRVLPVVGLRPGYRHIALRNESGQPLTLPTLFVYITVKDYVPDKLSGLADALVNPIKYQSELEKRAQQLSALTDDFDQEFDDDSPVGDPKKPRAERTPVKSSASLEAPRNKIVKATSSVDSSGGGSGKEESGGLFPSTGHLGLSSTLPPEGAMGVEKEPPKRKDSKKTLQSTKINADPSGLDVSSTHFEIPDHLLVAETLEKIKESKPVQLIFAKLEKELFALRKRHNKLQSKTSDSLKREEEKLEKQKLKGTKSLSKLRKTSVEVATAKLRPTSVSVCESGPETELLKLHRTHSETLFTLCQDKYKDELEIQKKYHEQIYDAIEKSMRLSHDVQLTRLDEHHESYKDEVKKKSNIQRADEIKDLKKLFRDKNERARMKREIQQKHINQAVAELQKLEEYYQSKRKELERLQEDVCKKFEDDKGKAMDIIKGQYDDQMSKMQETVLLGEAPNKSPSTDIEVTSL